MGEPGEGANGDGAARRSSAEVYLGPDSCIWLYALIHSAFACKNWGILELGGCWQLLNRQLRVGW
jgi:hypothetical protein